jgi:tetratricopeptide (TPR) repeat protein
MQRWAVAASVFFVTAAATQFDAQHASHRLAPIALEVVERPVTLRPGIGRAHDQTATTSKEAQALYDQGLTYLHSYVWIEAARSFNAALKIDPKLAMAHAGLSVAYVELSRPVEARKALDAARALAATLPDHDRRHVDARVLQVAAEDAPADATRLPAYRKALDAAINAHPNDVEFLLLRGMAETPDPAERGQGSTTASATYYQRALQLAPDHFAAHHYLAHAHENAGRSAEALQSSGTYAKAAPNVPHARHMYGHNLRRTGRTHDAIAEFEAADRLHREYIKAEKIPGEYDWHYEHNLGLLGTSLQYVGQMKRAEAILKTAFALPTGLLVQAYNKREWPMFLRARGRYQDAEAAAKMLIANPNPVVQATGHIEAGLTYLAVNNWGAAGTSSNAALKLLRGAPGGGIAANALLSLQGEFYLRTAARDKGRATIEEVAKRVRAAPGPDLWAQALFTLEALARAARAVGDWELAGRLARQMLDHDPHYAGSHYALALAAEHDGDTATASAEFKQALALWGKADQDFAELSEIRKRVRGGR